MRIAQLQPEEVPMPLDPAYQTVAPDDFPAMLEPARYARRTPHFEEIIARTEEPFWNPEDRDYIDFDQPWPAAPPPPPLRSVAGWRTAVSDQPQRGQWGGLRQWTWRSRRRRPPPR